MASALEPVFEALVATARTESGTTACRRDRGRPSQAIEEHTPRHTASWRKHEFKVLRRPSGSRHCNRSRHRRCTVMVLGARQKAYEALRQGAIGALALRATTTEGRMLTDRLSALVKARLGRQTYQLIKGQSANVLWSRAWAGNRRSGHRADNADRSRLAVDDRGGRGAVGRAIPAKECCMECKTAPGPAQAPRQRAARRSGRARACGHAGRDNASATLGWPPKVVSVRRGLVTAQVYEYTGGVLRGRPGGQPRTAAVGPARSEPGSVASSTACFVL